MNTLPEGGQAGRTPVIDASVHIFSKSNKDLRSFERERLGWLARRRSEPNRRMSS